MLKSNFVNSHISISCFNCDGCSVYYDPVHDEHFSDVCGLVVMCNNVLLVDYGVCGVKRIIFNEK